MSELKRVYNMNPRRISELIDEVMAEIESSGGMEDAIRKEKACNIEDIFRSAKLAQLYDKRFIDELASPVAFFDKLYDLELHALEAYSITLDNCNTRYMRGKVAEHNNGWLHVGFRKKPDDDSFWTPYNDNFGI